jgi:O-antigen/teichoic acid export membrane protein
MIKTIKKSKIKAAKRRAIQFFSKIADEVNHLRRDELKRVFAVMSLVVVFVMFILGALCDAVSFFACGHRFAPVHDYPVVGAVIIVMIMFWLFLGHLLVVIGKILINAWNGSKSSYEEGN